MCSESPSGEDSIILEKGIPLQWSVGELLSEHETSINVQRWCAASEADVLCALVARHPLGWEGCHGEALVHVCS